MARKMGGVTYETAIREYKAKKFAGKLEEVADAGFIIGSVAYSADYSVRKNSDLEVLLLIQRKKFRELMKFNNILEDEIKEDVINYFENKTVDIFNVYLKDEFNTSIIFWAKDLFENICNSLNLKEAKRFTRIKPHKIFLGGMDSTIITYMPQYKKVDRSFIFSYPIHYIDQGLFYRAGIPVENLLCNPKLLFGNKIEIDRNIKNLVRNLVDRSHEEIGSGGRYDYDPIVEEVLLRADRISPTSQEKIWQMIKEAEEEWQKETSKRDR